MDKGKEYVLKFSVLHYPLVFIRAGLLLMIIGIDRLFFWLAAEEVKK